MSILNVNQLQPVGGGNTITVGSSNIDYSGSITGNISVDGNLTVTGVVSNEDVTNIDSVGVVTARSGVNITGGDLTLPDAIIHTGDTNTRIRFPASDTFTVETAGNERFRIDSTGNTLIYGVLRKDNVNSSLSISGGNGADSSANIILHGSSGSPANVTQFRTGSIERLRITSDGKVGIGSEIPGGVLDLYHATSNTILNVKSGDAGSVLNLIDNSARSSIEQNGTSLKISSDTGAEFANSDIRLQTDGSTRVLINSVGDVLFSGLTSKNDGRNAKGITLKSPSGISFQNFGGNGSRNWRIRPDDLSSWGSLEFSVSPTDNNNTDWPDAAGDVVLELKKDKDVVVSNGNLSFGTSGNGISFAATSDASGMSSELLDDYEEGTWTPTVLSAGSIGSAQYNCTYTKIGRLVTINADIHALTDTTSSTRIQIGGIPYVAGPSTGGEWCTVCMGERYNSSLIVAFIQNDGGWKIKFRTGVGSSNYADLTHAAINDNGTDNNLRFTLTYEVL